MKMNFEKVETLYFFPYSRKDDQTSLRSKRSSVIQSQVNNEDVVHWNAREEMRLLDAVEQYGYGNWKDIARHIETKTPEQAKEEYIRHYIHGCVGKHTWKEELRGYQIDHTQAADRGPLSPTLTGIALCKGNS